MFKKYILAVSGGPDSMAMLNMYKKKAQAVCTVNYNKRKTSDYDLKIVKEFCQQHHIKFYDLVIKKEVYKKEKIENFQSFARKLRYDFFIEIAKLEKNNHLMIAHNLNDSLETAYMQFKRNSKALYYGIKQKTNYHSLKIYRPLLNYQKDCLLRYCRTNQIPFAIDESNESDIYERNRVRKIIKNWSQEELMNFIKKINQYNRKHKKMFKQVNKVFNEWNKLNFSLNYYLEQNEKIQYYLIYEWLKLHNEKNNSQNKIQEIMKFILAKNPHKVYRLENSKKIIKEKNQLIIV